MATTKTVESYIAGFEGWQGKALARLRAIILKNAPGVTGSIKWGQPVFEVNGPCMYLKGFKNHVNIGFWRGADLPDPEGMVEGGGKRMGHVKIAGIDDVKEKPLTALVKAAAALNRKLGDPTKR